jgi:Cof subfamily protein (haloacid dehalogenase superfamily)
VARLLIADVDGTLVTPDKRLTRAACGAVARLRAAGIRFSIVSGRPPHGMAMLTRPLGLTEPIAAFNGGMLMSADLRTVLEQKFIPREIAAEAVDFFLASGVDTWVYRGSEWFVRDLSAPHVDQEQSTVRFAPTRVEDVRDVLDGAVKIVGVSDDEPRLERCESELRDRICEQASAARSQPYYLDVTHPDANKGCVVRFLSRACGIPADEIAVIGDMPNDVLMFGVAGMSIAMGNSSSEVKRAARYVTASNRDEGFARAVDRFVLGALHSEKGKRRMEWKLTRNDPARAREFFEKKMTFTLGPMEVQYFKEQGEAFNVIDVRQADDFAEGHVPGAVNLPEDRWDSLAGLSQDKPNVIYCYSVVCHLAAKACIFFASKGFSVIEMDGGWEYWQHYKLPEEKTGKTEAA